MTTTNLTKEQISELKKCMNDPVYFICNYLKVITLNDGLKNFELYDCQKKKVNFINDNKGTIFAEGRQQGKTKVPLAYILWKTLFQPQKSAQVISVSEVAKKESWNVIRTMYNNLPAWQKTALKGDIEKNNGNRLEFENGSSIRFSTDIIRGLGANLIFLDECAFLKPGKLTKILNLIEPFVRDGITNNKVILSSTPRDEEKEFRQVWEDALEGKNNFKPMQIHASEFPERDKEWIEEMKNALGDRKFRVEILADFEAAA